MNLKKYISPEKIFFLKNRTKEEAIRELFSYSSPFLESEHKEKILEGIFYREEIMSTGVGVEVGVPHLRRNEIKAPLITIGIQRDGITDYETIDNSIVKIVILILLEEDQHKEHIRLLSKFISILKESELRSSVINSKSGKEIYSLIIERS